MKKLLTILLCMAMVLSLGLLTACGSETAEAPETVTDVTEAAEAVEEVVSDGEKHTVAYCIPTMADAYIAGQVESLENYYADNPNVEVVIAECGGNQVTQIEHIENYTAMGADVIIILPTNPFGMEVAVNNARENGVRVMFQNIGPDTEIDVLCTTDNDAVGRATAGMALAWLDKAYPDAEEGSIHCAIFVSNELPILQARTQAIQSTLEADPRVTISYVSEGTADTSNAQAEVENAFTADPDIKFICAWTNDYGTAFDAVVAGRGYDITQYGAFTAGVSDATLELIGLSETNESPMRGTVNYLAYELGQVADWMMEESIEMPTVLYDEIEVLNSFGYEFAG